MGRRRLTLTTRGAVVLGIVPVSAIAGGLLGVEELVLLSLALLSLGVCGLVQSSYRASRARGDWRVSVDLTTSDAEIDSVLTVTVTLVTAGRVHAPVWLEEPEHCWERVGHGPVTSRRVPLPNPSSVLRVPVLESGGTLRFRFGAPTGRRGVFALPGLRVWCFDSFGFVAQLVAVGPSATISVHPTPAQLRLADELLRGVADDSQPVASPALPRRDSFGDFSGIRPYVPGDRLRLLYWPALARSGELLVRDFEDSGPHRVHVMADVRPLVGDAGCESVLAVVAGVGLQVLAQGMVLELSTTSGERMAVGPGPLGTTALLRLLAQVDTSAVTVPRRARLGRRRTLPPELREQEFPLAAGKPLVVTTEAGADALPGSFGFAHLVIAP